MVQVRPLAPLTLTEFIDLDEAKAWELHNRGLVAFKDEEEGLMAAILAGTPYQAPAPPPAPAEGSSPAPTTSPTAPAGGTSNP